MAIQSKEQNTERERAYEKSLKFLSIEIELHIFSKVIFRFSKILVVLKYFIYFRNVMYVSIRSQII